MTLDQIIAGVTTYVEKEVAAPAPSGMQKFFYYATLPFVGKTIRQMAEQYKGLAEAMEIRKPDGQWDLAQLKAATTDAIRKSGAFEVAGIIFREEDLVKLWSYVGG